MKQLLIIIVLLIPTLAICQKHDTKGEGDKTEIVFSGDYLIERDTTESGVVTIRLIPTIEIAKELESKLGSVRGEISNLDAQIQSLQSRQDMLRKEEAELEALIVKGGDKQDRSAKQPVVKKKRKN